MIADAGDCEVELKAQAGVVGLEDFVADGRSNEDDGITKIYIR